MSTKRSKGPRPADIGFIGGCGYRSPMQYSLRRPSAGFATAIVALCLLAASSRVLSADVATAPGGAPRVVNVTSDSTPGWLPSRDLERQALKTAVDYMAAMDGGRFAEAYAAQAEAQQRGESLEAFSDGLRRFNATAGPVVERRIATVTWTDNPAHAPLPGVYVAIDLVSRFANIDRHCGYLVLYQAPLGGPFKVMRQEDNFMDNASAATIARTSSPAAVDAAWAKVSANCPGYETAANSTRPASPVDPAPPIAETPTSNIGYPTVGAALAALHAKPGVVFRTQSGWTVAEDAAAQSFWSFPPPGHPAYPAAVKRHLVENAGAVSMEMSVICGATKRACDDLVRSFEKLNAQMAASLHGRQ